MLITARFGEVLSHLGYQFFDSTGALLGARVTDGITATPETGAYLASATVPDGAVGVYWNDSETGAESSEDLTIALKFEAATTSDPLIIPPLPEDSTLGTVYLYTADLIAAKRSGIVVSFTLSTAPARATRVLETSAQSMTTDTDGFATINLQRTDAITPAGSYYLVNCAALGIKDLPMDLTAASLDLATLIL